MRRRFSNCLIQGSLLIVTCILLVQVSAYSSASADESPGDVSEQNASSDQAASLQIVKPFLWRIECDAPNGESTAASWLFGTIHVPDPEITTLHPAAQKAFDDAQAAYFEIDFLKASDRQTQAISLPSDQKLEDLLSPELLKQLDDRLKKMSAFTSRSALPNAQIGVWPLLLGNLQAQIRKLGELPLDMKLYVTASQKGKEVGGLESPDSQLRGLLSLSRDDQTTFLKATLDGMDADDAQGIDRIQEVLELYAGGDETKFVELFEEEFRRIHLPPELTERILDGLLRDRNQKMAVAIDELIQKTPEKSCFFAVGLGHLTGRRSVQEFLIADGYRISRQESIQSEAGSDDKTSAAGAKK
jgi:uncharacterized protein YbaP (TraB family)